jgi:hypothetical protein
MSGEGRLRQEVLRMLGEERRWVPLSSKKLLDSTVRKYSAGLRLQLQAIAVAQGRMEEDDRALLEAMLLPSHQEWFESRAWLWDNLPSQANNARLGFEALMYMACVPKSLYQGPEAMELDKRRRVLHDDQNPSVHARAAPGEAVLWALEDSYAVAKRALKALEQEKAELGKLDRKLERVRLWMGDVRLHFVGAISLAMAGRNSCLAQAALSVPETMRARTKFEFPGGVATVWVANAKGQRVALGPLRASKVKHADPARAWGLMFRAWQLAGLSLPPNQERSLVTGLRGVAPQSWGKTLSKEAAGKAIAKFYEVYVGPAEDRGKPEGRFPLHSGLEKLKYSGHSARHTAGNVLAQGGASDGDMMLLMRNKSPASSLPYRVSRAGLSVADVARDLTKER